MQGSAGSVEPSAAEVRAELERILASRCFEQAGRSSSFLRFVVEQTLAGQGERLKGYTIAVEVFGRPPDFDAQTDPLVRVEAGRLRRRMIEYYADEGRDDPVRLELPRGRYYVVSTYHVPLAADAQAAAEMPDAPAAAPAEAPAANAAARNRSRWRRIRTFFVVAAILAGVAVIVSQRREVARLEHGAPSTTSGLDGRPAIVVLPFEVLGGAVGLGELAATLTEEVFLVLDGPERLVVPAEASGEVTFTMPGYLLTGSVRETDGQVRITARVVQGETGTQLWSAAYDEPIDALGSAAGQRRVARLVALAAEPYGPIFKAELERMRSLTAHEPTTRECLLRYYEYRRKLGAAEHARALDCFEVATAREPQNAEAWAGLSLLITDAWAHGFAGQGGKMSVLEKAREMARRAMDIDGRNLHANLALAGAQFMSGAEFRDGAERVLRAWPENAEAQGFVGAMFVLSGETALGSALLEQAIEWTPEATSGNHALRSLVALREQRYADALASALRIDSPDWALGHLIVAAATALGGRPDLAARARTQLIELDPTIATSRVEVLRRWRVEPVLALELERGFAAALPGP
jgi:adenylate cyclase